MKPWYLEKGAAGLGASGFQNPCGSGTHEVANTWWPNGTCTSVDCGPDLYYGPNGVCVDANGNLPAGMPSPPNGPISLPANGTFVPVPVYSTGPRRTLPSITAGQIAPVDPSAPTGQTTPAAPLAVAPAAGATTTVQTPSGSMVVPIGPPVVQTDPSTGSTSVTEHNPDGSITVTTSGGPTGESSSVTYPAIVVFLEPRDPKEMLVLALGVGAVAMGLLVLAVNSRPGEKVLAVVAKPVDNAAKAVGIPELPSVLPEGF